MSDIILLEIKEDVKLIKEKVIRLSEGQAVDHQILKDHERRSTNLEERILPLEDVYKFGAKLFTVILALGTIVELVHVLIK